MDEIIKVGSKGTMSYVLAICTAFRQGAKEVTVVARGNHMGTAITAAIIATEVFGGGSLSSVIESQPTSDPNSRVPSIAIVISSKS